MTNIDQFESVFKAAAKTVYEYEPFNVRNILVITDKDEAGTKAFGDDARKFLRIFDQDVTWKDIPESAYSNVGDLLKLVENEKPDLICTYRNLRSNAWKWPYTLGSYLTALTQDASPSVMVLPHPDAERAADHALQNTDAVMAITDHLTGDHQLVNVAARFAEAGGKLYLTHIEGRADFERFIDAISKIPSIETDSAREDIIKQLLKEPREYIDSCRTVLKEKSPGIQVETIVTLGRRLTEYKKLIEQHTIDLLVFHSRDEDQLAMHGLAHPLAVELRHIPLLMI